MERLTIPAEKLPDGRTGIQVVDSRAVAENAMEFYWRLKAYEDTGLTPEQVAALKQELVDERYRHDRLQDFEVDESLELAKFKQVVTEGRLLKPPCKLGDILYEVDEPEYGVITCKAESITYFDGPAGHVPGNRHVRCWSVGVEVIAGHGIGSGYAFEDQDFGNIVFLTPEEAEAKLNEVQK